MAGPSPAIVLDLAGHPSGRGVFVEGGNITFCSCLLHLGGSYIYIVTCILLVI